MLKLLIFTVVTTALKVTNSVEIKMTDDLCILPEKERCASATAPFKLETADEYDRGFYMRYCKTGKNLDSFPIIEITSVGVHPKVIAVFPHDFTKDKTDPGCSVFRQRGYKKATIWPGENSNGGTFTILAESN